MSDDLVERLRDFDPHQHEWEVVDEAADRIEQLTAECDRLRVALTRLLEPFEEDPCYYDHHGYCQAHFVESDCCVAYGRGVLKGETT